MQAAADGGHGAELRRRVARIAADIETRGADCRAAGEAHTLKGAALTLGLDDLAVAAAALEAACDDDDGDVAAAGRALALAGRILGETSPDPTGRLWHDLRGALNLVVGYASLLGREPLTTAQAASVREILVAADTMTTLLRGAETGASGVAASGADAPEERPRRILLVEDDEVTARLIGQVARETGSEVVVAPTAARALEEAEALRPDLVVLDLRLPDADGRDLLRRLRALPALAGVPVAISSGDTGERLRRELLEDGATAILAKPLRPDLLLALVPGPSPVAPPTR